MHIKSTAIISALLVAGCNITTTDEQRARGMQLHQEFLDRVNEDNDDQMTMSSKNEAPMELPVTDAEEVETVDKPPIMEEAEEEPAAAPSVSGEAEEVAESVETSEEGESSLVLGDADEEETETPTYGSGLGSGLLWNRGPFPPDTSGSPVVGPPEELDE